MVRGIEVHTTDQCNLDCYYCCSKAFRDATFMRTHEFDVILEKVKQLGYRFILFSGGGEPALNKTLNEYFQRTVETGMKFALITNGTAMDEWEVQDTQYFLENAEWIRISLDTCDPQAYRRIKGKDAFPLVLAFLERIQVYRARKAKVGIQLIFNATFSTDEAIRCADLVERFRLDYVFVKSLHFQKPPMCQLEGVRQFAEELGEMAILDSYLHNKRFKVPECYAPYYMGAVDTKGNLWGCCKLRGKQFLLGNLIREDLQVLRNRLREQIPIKRELLCPPSCLGIPPYPEIDSFGILLEGKEEFVVAVDLDGVITTVANSHHSDYSTLVPNSTVIQNLREIRRMGAKIVIYTSRMREDDVITIDWLNYHQIPYDEICFEKLRADVYIDDRNLALETGWELELQRILDSHKPGGGESNA